MPPLALFKSHGFITAGVELDDDAIEVASMFAKDQGMVLDIQKGDMTALDFEDGSFDFVYSYKSIFHMKKAEIEQSIKELKRVLKPSGLMFVIHSYYAHDEADLYFMGMKTLIKEVRVLHRIHEGQSIKQGFVDYRLEKTF